MRSAPRGKETPGNFGPTPKNEVHPPHKALKRPEVTTRPTSSAGAAERREWKSGAAGFFNTVSQDAQRPQALRTPRRCLGRPAYRAGHGRTDAPRSAAHSSRRLPKWKTYTDIPSLGRRWFTGRRSSPSRRRSWGLPSERDHPSGRTQPPAGKSHRPHLINIASRVPGPRRGNSRARPAGRLAPNRVGAAAPQRVERAVKAPERIEPRKPATDVRRPAPSQGTPARGVQRPAEGRSPSRALRAAPDSSC